jgi:hypothetical protein
MVGDYRVDVKSGQMRDRYLCWPIGKNDLFKKKQFDILAFTKIDLINSEGYTAGWVTKDRFLRERLVAGAGHKLMADTRHMDQDSLTPIEEFPDSLGPVKPLLNYCPCGQRGSFGYGVSLIKGKTGMWFCFEHRPIYDPT